jgi:hypothetical protein
VASVLFGVSLLVAVIMTATSGRSLSKGMSGTQLSSFPIFIAASRPSAPSRAAGSCPSWPSACSAATR